MMARVFRPIQMFNRKTGRSYIDRPALGLFDMALVQEWVDEHQTPLPWDMQKVAAKIAWELQALRGKILDDEIPW